MDLNERKKRILQAIINDYINTADPVGSRTISKKYNLGLSSATIRNEMADLEDLGYLEQPHTSAGRIPSNTGYRFYVDQLMSKYRLTVDEIRDMRKAMKFKIQELDKMINDYSKIVSKLTNYTTVVMSPKMNRSSIRYLQLIPVDTYTALLVIITNAGIIKNKPIRFNNEIENDFLNKLTNILNDKLSNRTLDEINLQKIQEIQREMSCDDEYVLIPVLKAIAEGINQIDRSDVFLSGTTNLLNFPEYKDVDKARDFLNFLEEKAKIENLLNDANGEEEIRAVIGDENKFKEMKDCSVIISKYTIGDRVVGKIGVIGPTRMEYAKVISSLEYLTGNLNYLLMKFFYDDED